MLDSSEEGPSRCLGLVPGVCRLLPGGAGLKVPHMGWNSVRFTRVHPIFDGIKDDDEFYFVHSYYPQPLAEEWIAGVTDYGFDFCSVIAKENLVAVQFHPEKSGLAGLKILQNFSNWSPSEQKRL